MRKLTPRLPIAGSPISSGSLAWSLCSAFVRSSIPLEGKRSCTFWASTDLNGTAFWSADFARIFRWWIWVGIWDFRQRAQKRSEEHTSELQSHSDLVCRLLLE